MSVTTLIVVIALVLSLLLDPLEIVAELRFEGIEASSTAIGRGRGGSTSAVGSRCLTVQGG